jgi:hypothetical protein
VLDTMQATAFVVLVQKLSKRPNGHGKLKTGVVVVVLVVVVVCVVDIIVMQFGPVKPAGHTHTGTVPAIKQIPP